MINNTTPNGKIREMLKSRNFRISLIATAIGSIAGFLFYYFGELNPGEAFSLSKAMIGALWGGLLGLFIVNSPCSRGRC